MHEMPQGGRADRRAPSRLPPSLATAPAPLDATVTSSNRVDAPPRGLVIASATITSDAGVRGLSQVVGADGIDPIFGNLDLGFDICVFLKEV
jgi:hypothetical protein